MGTRDKELFKSLVEDSLRNRCSLSKDEALGMMNESTFQDLLEEDPMFVAHYPPEYWVEDIVAEYKLLSE